MEQIVILADIHANLDALIAVFDDINSRNIAPSKIIINGDVISLGPEPNECIEFLKAKDNICYIQGNHERYVINRDFLDPDNFAYFRNGNFPIDFNDQIEWTYNQLSQENIKFIQTWNNHLTINRNGKTFYITHGIPENDEKGIFPAKMNKTFYSKNSHYDFYIFGHVHCPFIHTHNSIYYANPGSVGDPLDKDLRASYLSIEIDDKIDFEITRVEYDLKKVIEKIHNRDIPWKDTIISVLKKGSLF